MKGGREGSRGPPEGWQDLETELLPLPATLPEYVTQGQASEGRRNKRLLRQVEINSYWADLGAGKKSSWCRAKSCPGELGHT